MSRPVAGLACKIRMSLRRYQAIAVVARDGGHTVRLMHSQPGLCVDLVVHADFAAAEDHCDRLADFLDLPPLMLAGKAASTGAPKAEAAPAPRRTKPAQSRRPRFLKRRQTGQPTANRTVAGQELIARS